MTRPRDKDELWQDFYEEGIEEGLDMDEAGQYANAKLADHYADLADDAHDRMKDGDL